MVVNRLKLLFFGDVVGQAGCEKLRSELPRLKKDLGVGIVIANGENSAEGNGITPHSARYLFDSGVDVITTGNHSLRRREIYEVLEEQKGVIRPANYHPDAPGSGVYYYDHPAFPLCVINLQGKVYMDGTYQNPFACSDELLATIKCPNILVDFHAEATAEKLALGHYLDGRVSAVIGTHTHVQTADERLLPNGTAYITDVGMCGGRDSVLGVEKDKAIERMRTNLPCRFCNDSENIELNGVLLEFGKLGGKVITVSRIRTGQ